ncbi:MAG: restriction endonuclease subunit S [Alistipes sp.]|nr:restriction endonuclease subunit S [Alistipes sp.]
MKQGWEIKKLGEVCAFQRGLTYSKDDEVEHSNNCVLRSNNIDLDSMSIVLDELKYINDDFAVSEDKKVKPNTILICMSNGSKQHIGKVAFIDKEYGYAFGGFMGLIRPNAEVSPKFIYYSCISSSYKHFLAGIGNGANITNLKFSDLQQYTLPVPPREEQERIVAELDCLSGVIERKREQLKQLDALAQSIFYQMFGDPITNEKRWEVKKLGEVCEDKKKILRASKKCALEDVINYIDISAIDNINNVINIPTQYIFEDAPSRAQQVVQLGDVIVSMVRPNLKNIAIVNCNYDNLIASSGFCVLRVKKEMTIPFLFYIVKSDAFTMYLMDRVSGANYPAVRESDITDYISIIPPLTFQQEFADKIEAIEKQKELIKQSITQTEELFNSRMNYYFN